MTHRICRVVDFEIVGACCLRVKFDDASEQTIDLEPVLRGELYGPLRDKTMFNLVALDAEVGTLVWPNGADFDPATLHDWPECGSAFAEMASRWELVPA